MPIELAGKLPGPVAFVLAGGASYGAVQVGQIRALAKTDLRPDMVVGTSVGALNGTIVAEDPESAPDRLAALWSSVVREDVFGKTLPTAYRLAPRVSHRQQSTAKLHRTSDLGPKLHRSQGPAHCSGD